MYLAYMIRMACNLETRANRFSWSPEDFGQARMAALGWLLSLESRHKAKGEGLVGTVRKAALKAPADVRALWDWFYLCQMRYDNAALFEVASKLSRAAANDPIALWAFLHVMGGRHLPLGSELYFSQLTTTLMQEESAAPLDSAELDHAMACYRALRSRRPDLASALVLINISDELKRAKRLDQEERFYREAIAGPTRLGQIAGAFMLAARRGDADGLAQLFERYDRAQTGRTAPRTTPARLHFPAPVLLFLRA